MTAAAICQALLMGVPPASFPGTTLIYIGAQVSEIGGLSAANSGTLGGALVSATSSLGQIGGAPTAAAGINAGPYASATCWSLPSVGAAVSSLGVGETFEFYGYFTNPNSGSPTISVIIANSASSGFSASVEVGYFGGGATQIRVRRDSGISLYLGNSVSYGNAWLHFAISKDSAHAWRFYLNGFLLASDAGTNLINSADRVTIARSGSGLDGLWVANLRYRVNHVYTSDFSPPSLI